MRIAIARPNLKERAYDRDAGSGRDRPATVGDRNVKHIVVGVDGSPGATRALDWAAAAAERTSSLLTVVGAWAFGGIAGAVRNADDAGGNVEEAEARVAELH